MILNGKCDPNRDGDAYHVLAKRIEKQVLVDVVQEGRLYFMVCGVLDLSPLSLSSGLQGCQLVSTSVGVGIWCACRFLKLSAVTPIKLSRVMSLRSVSFYVSSQTMLRLGIIKWHFR